MRTFCPPPVTVIGTVRPVLASTAVSLKSRPMSDFRPYVKLVDVEFPTAAEFPRHDPG
jgi:hypothetical protein